MGGFERWLLSGKKVDDVRLSTAAHNSARFPLISPPGSICNQDQAIVDRIVDGGYFENYGALGAKRGRKKYSRRYTLYSYVDTVLSIQTAMDKNELVGEHRQQAKCLPRIWLLG